MADDDKLAQLAALREQEESVYWRYLAALAELNESLLGLEAIHRALLVKFHGSKHREVPRHLSVAVERELARMQIGDPRSKRIEIMSQNL